MTKTFYGAELSSNCLVITIVNVWVYVCSLYLLLLPPRTVPHYLIGDFSRYIIAEDKNHKTLGDVHVHKINNNQSGLLSCDGH